MKSRSVKVMVLALIVCLCVVCLVACGGNDSAGKPKPSEPNPLAGENATLASGANTRIMTYNVLVEAWNTGSLKEVPFKNRVANVANVLGHYAPDVVGLQEFCEQWHSAVEGNKAFKDYKVIFDGPLQYTSMAYNTKKVNLVDNGIANYSKVYLKKDASTMRYIAWAVFEKKSDGKKFIVMSTHCDFIRTNDMSSSSSILETQLMEYGALANTLSAQHNAPAFMLGDYNVYDIEVEKGHPAYENPDVQSVERYEIFRDTYMDTLSDAKYLEGIEKVDGEFTKVTDPTWDHIFVTKNATVKRWSVLASKFYMSVSDHCPQYVDVAL